MIATARPVCPGCSSPQSRTFHRLDAWRIRRCLDCTLLYVDPLPDAEELLRYAHDAHEGRDGLDETQDYFRHRPLDDPDDPVVADCRRQLARLERYVSSGHLLDVGCGNGTFAAVATQRGWVAHGVDSSAAAAESAAAYDLEVTRAAFPADPLPGQSWAAITMFDFLEHVRDPRSAVEQAIQALAPEGALLIASPNHRSLLCAVIDTLGRLPVPALRQQLENYYHHSHVTVFNPRALKRLVETAGGRVVAHGVDSPVLDRFDLPWTMRTALEMIATLSRPFQLESRLWAIARPA